MSKYLKNQAILHFALLIALFSLIGALIYRFYALNNIGVFLAIGLSALVFIIILYFQYKNKIEADEEQKTKIKKYSGLALIFYFILTTASFFILFKSQSANSINSPWTEIPKYFFPIYFLAISTLFFLILKTNKFIIPLLSLHYFLSFSIALIVYKIGFGFDPFVHQATEALIREKGAVDPKPFYYLGQYSLVIILNKITFLPIVFLDKILVPLLSALILPAFVYKFLGKWFENNRANILLILLLLALPFSFFIVTTPQNLAYLFLFLTILSGLIYINTKSWPIVYIFALSCLLTHPIAGIPALLYATALFIYCRLKIRLKKTLLAILFLIFAFALPLAFSTLEKDASQAEGTTEQTLSLVGSNWKLWNEINFSAPRQENMILNFIYLFEFNLKLILIILTMAGIIIFLKNRSQENNLFLINLYSALALFVSFLCLQNFSFAYVIDYERGDFINRILILTSIFLFPFILIAFYWLIEKALRQNKASKIILSIFALLLITNSLYLSYPRSDRYHNFKGYSVSQTDINAVKWIEENSEEDYIVLANQQVGASALREIGFTKYHIVPSPYQGEGQGEVELYLYPIPTSSPLYQYYLKMVYEKPTKKTMQEAMDLVGVNEAYFVLNKYWWAFDKILAEAKLEADSWEEIDGGEIYVFRHKR